MFIYKFSSLCVLLCVFSCGVLGQNYTSYFTGNTTDVASASQGGICLMGGATEDEEGMKWFLNRANGGDVLVLRTSGTDGYNSYFFNDLGITLNSVETIVCHNANASNEMYIQQKIQQAEAIWFAGGDQWDYISFWRGTKIDSLINDAIHERNVVIGGTSAGMAIQGKYYFTAQNSTITSGQALSNPFDVNLTVDSLSFIKNNFLEDVITDTHYDNPDRKGRHITFLARILTSYQTVGKGIACEEYAAVCIEPTGKAIVFGNPNFDDFAYFIQPNCDLSDFSPENCTSGNPLDWNRNQEALAVYKVKGTANGSNFLELSDWKTGFGGEWLRWSVANGTLSETSGTAITCLSSSIIENENSNIELFPNPTEGILHLNSELMIETLIIKDVLGKDVFLKSINSFQTTLDVSNIPKGNYICVLKSSNKTQFKKIVIQ